MLIQERGIDMVEKLNGLPEAESLIYGNKKHEQVYGNVSFYDVYGGSIAMAELYGLPDEEEDGVPVFGVYMGEQLLFPVVPVNGAAWCAIYTGAFHPDDLEGKQVTIERIPENMKAQFLEEESSEERFVASGKVKEFSESRREMGISAMQKVDGN